MGLLRTRRLEHLKPDILAIPSLLPVAGISLGGGPPPFPVCPSLLVLPRLCTSPPLPQSLAPPGRAFVCP